jgi:hypothetical protein
VRGFAIASLALALFAAPAGQAHNVPGIHNRVHAVHWAFCWSLSVYAGNGQYLGMFQFGGYARAAYGFGWNPWAQSAAAYRYYRAAGWSPWECAGIVGLL